MKQYLLHVSLSYSPQCLEFGIISNSYLRLSVADTKTRYSRAPRKESKKEGKDQESIQSSIARPVKRDWAVLSKDTPLDISM